MLEEAGEKVAGEGVGVPDNEAIVGGTPGDDRVGGGVIDDVESLGKEGRGGVSEKAINGKGGGRMERRRGVKGVRRRQRRRKGRRRTII